LNYSQSKVTALFTKNKSPGSWLIRKITRQPVSHVALVFYNHGECLVFHSKLLGGVELLPLAKFLEKNEIVAEAPTGISTNQLFDIFHLQERAPSAAYDYGAILFWFFVLMLGRLGFKRPKSNLWQTSSVFLCTEVLFQALNWPQRRMLTPWEVYEALNGSNSQG
jgi:hypothetical protein